MSMMSLNKLILILFLFLLWNCAPKPYGASNKIYKEETKTLSKKLQEPPSNPVSPSADWIGTTNFDLRKPNFVIIHHTAQNSCEQTLATFTTEKSKVSAHYVICKDGTIHHMLNDYLRAWQAGVSKWGNNTDINSSSIGIELDNNGFEYFTEPQINQLMILLDTLKKKYNIPTANFIGHGDIAPGRKIDPNWRFPWKLLSEHGFGNWFADSTDLPAPASYDHLQALRIIGYDMKDTVAAINSFKRHWLQDTTSPVLNVADLRALYFVSRSYQ